MAAECGRRLAERFRQLSWEEGGAQEGLRAWGPTLQGLGTQGPWEACLPFGSFCLSVGRESAP